MKLKRLDGTNLNHFFSDNRPAVLSTVPYHKFQIRISTEEFNREDEDNGLACQLVFTYTEKYPDSAPLVEIDEPTDFEDGYEGELLESIQETVSWLPNYRRSDGLRCF